MQGRLTQMLNLTAQINTIIFCACWSLLEFSYISGLELTPVWPFSPYPPLVFVSPTRSCIYYMLLCKPTAIALMAIDLICVAPQGHVLGPLLSGNMIISLKSTHCYLNAPQTQSIAIWMPTFLSFDGSSLTQYTCFCFNIGHRIIWTLIGLAQVNA